MDTYSRSYGQRDAISLPDGYDGIALREVNSSENRDTGPTLEEKSDAKRCDGEACEGTSARCENADTEVSAKEDGESFLASVPFLRGIFDAGKIPFLSSVKMPHIGYQEILIIGAALLMLFSKNGDKECAIILGLLLFVH